MHCLQYVAIQINDERCIIAGAIFLSWPGCSTVSSASGKCGGVESDDRRPAGRHEGQMETPSRSSWSRFGEQRESVHPACFAKTDAAVMSPKSYKSERGKAPFVEPGCPIEIADAERKMAEHCCPDAGFLVRKCDQSRLRTLLEGDSIVVRTPRQFKTATGNLGQKLPGWISMEQRSSWVVARHFSTWDRYRSLRGRALQACGSRPTIRTHPPCGHIGWCRRRQFRCRPES